MLCLLASKTASEDAVFLVLWVLPQSYIYIYIRERFTGPTQAFQKFLLFYGKKR